MLKFEKIIRCQKVNSEVRHEVPNPHKTEREFKFPALSSAHLLPAEKMQNTYNIKIQCSVKMSSIALVDGNISAGDLNLFIVMVNGKKEKCTTDSGHNVNQL